MPTNKKEEIQELKGADIYLKDAVYINTVLGEKILVPKLAWGKEIKLAKLLGEAIRKVPSFITFLKDFRGIGTLDEKKLMPKLGDKAIGGIAQMLPEILENIPDIFTKSAGVMLDKNVEWVEKNLDFDAVFELVLPFFARSLKKLLGKVGSLEDLIPEMKGIFSI